MDSSATFEDRFTRQKDLVPQDRLGKLRISVIGVSAIGRQVALQLAALKARRLQLVDFDDVDSTNVTTQGYFADDIGTRKVIATMRDVHRIDPSIDVEAVADRFRPTLALGEVVLCCVDSIETRAAIWRSAGRHASFWADGRMLGETIRVLVVASAARHAHYPTTLFTASEAHAGRCTAKSTIYCANISGGLLLHQFARWLRQQPVDADTLFNVLANELVIHGEAI